jgi:type VI secretion system protein ImpF
MARVEHDVRTTPSVVDRLLDDAPGESQERPLDWHEQIRALKESVGRDLEALLNTRQERLAELPEGLGEVSHSLMTYGLPDFSSLNLSSPADCSKVRRAIEVAVERFEPRLAKVRVLMDDPKNFDSGLRFRIEALLRVEPAPEPVTFDAVLQPATQEYDVQGQG